MPGRRLVPRRACHFLPGKWRRAGQTASDGFLGTSRLATPELFKGGPSCQSIKMMFFYGVHHCYITVSYTLCQGMSHPWNPSSLPVSLSVPRSHAQFHTCNVLPSPSSHQNTSVHCLSKQVFKRQLGAFLGTLQETFPPTLLLFYFPVLPSLLWYCETSFKWSQEARRENSCTHVTQC